MLFFYFVFNTNTDTCGKWAAVLFDDYRMIGELEQPPFRVGFSAGFLLNSPGFRL